MSLSQTARIIPIDEDFLYDSDDEVDEEKLISTRPIPIPKGPNPRIKTYNLPQVRKPAQPKNTASSTIIILQGIKTSNPTFKRQTPRLTYTTWEEGAVRVERSRPIDIPKNPPQKTYPVEGSSQKIVRRM